MVGCYKEYFPMVSIDFRDRYYVFETDLSLELFDLRDFHGFSRVMKDPFSAFLSVVLFKRRPLIEDDCLVSDELFSWNRVCEPLEFLPDEKDQRSVFLNALKKDVLGVFQKDDDPQLIYGEVLFSPLGAFMASKSVKILFGQSTVLKSFREFNQRIDSVFPDTVEYSKQFRDCLQLSN